MPQTGDPTPFVLLQTRFNELYGKFSPDGRWVAYISNESGRYEVYVTSFPKPTGKWQISSAGGTWPQWRGDGKEIYYIAPDSNIMAATVTSSGSPFQPGAVRPLFLARVVAPQRVGYAVSPDGQRFLLNSTSEQITAAPITLVVNWTAALKK